MHFRVFNTDHELALAGAYWQRQLRLEDWDVEYLLSVGATMEYDQGRCGVNDTMKCATIRLLRHNNSSDDGYDMEQTLVHELLHIYWHPYFDSDLKSLAHIAMEQTIDVLATTLVRLNRGLRR